MTDQIINLSAGAVEYCYPRTITETTGKDITTATVAVSLGTYDAPGVWVTPDVLDHPDPASVVVQILIGEALTPSAGAYYLHTRIGDSPEVVPRRSPGRIIIR